MPSRREVAAGLLTFGMPAVIPSGVLRRPGPNERIGVAAIGVGRQGSSVLRGAVMTGEVRVVSVCDVYGARAAAVAETLGAAHCTDFRRVLERKDVDAIITATPEHWRALICILACQAGKDLYVEKPLTLTIGEGRLMVAAAHKYGRVVQTGSQQRSMLVNQVGCELVRSGRIGRIQRVIANNYPSPWECALPARPIPSGLDWEMWCGPNPLVPYHPELYTPRGRPGWISFRPYSGGEMTGWGSHGLDQVQSALGMDHTGPVEIWVEGGPFSPPTYREPEDRARGERMCSTPAVFFRYANGVVVELATGPAGGAVFLGTEGRITIDRNQCVSYPTEIASDALKAAGASKPLPDTHMRNWLQCVRERKQPLADVEIGHRSATVCHLGNIARQLGRRLEWDPAAERFPGDDEANKLLHRPRRAPYKHPERV